MGWSCSWHASKTMDRWSEHCIKTTGSSNTFTENGKTYFWESSHREHSDGAITGSIFLMLDNDMCRKVGTFRINSDGTARAPKALKGLSDAVVGMVPPPMFQFR
jgi:hypothetical protein